jgi:hypothetical protein
VSQTILQRPDAAIERARDKRALRVDIAIASSVAAASAHLVAAPGHYLWWPASGLFFVGLGVAQLVVAVLLVFGVDDRRFVLTTVWGTVGVIGVYLASRTVGLPMTPPVPFHGTHWVPGQAMVPDGAKYVGPLDVLTLAAEILVVGTMLTMLPTRSKGERSTLDGDRSRAVHRRRCRDGHVTCAIWLRPDLQVRYAHHMVARWPLTARAQLDQLGDWYRRVPRVEQSSPARPVSARPDWRRS